MNVVRDKTTYPLFAFFCLIRSKSVEKICFVGNKIGFQLLLNDFSFEAVRRKKKEERRFFERLVFLKKYFMKNITKRDSGFLDFKIFWRACLQNPLARSCLVYGKRLVRAQV